MGTKGGAERPALQAGTQTTKSDITDTSAFVENPPQKRQLTESEHNPDNNTKGEGGPEGKTPERQETKEPKIDAGISFTTLKQAWGKKRTRRGRRKQGAGAEPKRYPNPTSERNAGNNTRPSIPGDVRGNAARFGEKNNNFRPNEPSTVYW